MTELQEIIKRDKLMAKIQELNDGKSTTQN